MVYEDAIMREAKRRSLQPNRVVSSPIDNRRWDQKAGDTGKKYLGSIWGGAQRGLDALTEGVAMSNENKRWFQENAPNAEVYADIPMNVRKSVMTQGDTDFFNKYTKLAEMEQDRKRKQYYLDQADTARRNLQVTKRINYGLGQMDLDETPFKGYESYDPGFTGFEGETGPRFDIDRFSEAMSEYLPGGEEITESVTEDFVPYDVDTGYGWEDDGLSGYPGYNDPITITDLMPEDITETITEDDFVLKESKFSQGNLGTEGEYDYTPSLDLNIMNIKDGELRKKATDAAIQFNNVWLEGEDGEYYGQLEDLYQEYLDAVEAGAQ